MLVCVLCTHENLWELMSAHEHSWVLMSFREHGAMVLMRFKEHPWAWHHGANITHERYWTFICMAPWHYGANSIYGALAPYSWGLMRAHECPWVSRSAHGCSLVPINVSERSGVYKFLIQLLTKNYNFWNDFPVVFWQYLGQDLTK